MKELLVATRNRAKMHELQLLLCGCVKRIYSLADYPDVPIVEEDGATFLENAVKKARCAAVTSGLPALADDSGLVVDALDGRPGVYSARFAGKDSDDLKNNEQLLLEMAGIPPEFRTGSFQCVIALCHPDGRCQTFSGELEGIILEAPRGNGGFGYDPLFLIPEYGKTLAELSLDIKNLISHRGKALKKFKDFVLTL